MLTGCGLCCSGNCSMSGPAQLEEVVLISWWRHLWWVLTGRPAGRGAGVVACKSIVAAMPFMVGTVSHQLRILLQVASILLPMAFLYDVWWVFLQPLVTGGDSVMIVVAQGGGAEQLPMLLEVPHKALGDVQAYSMLGYGDVILPGLLAVFAARLDAVRGLSWRCGYLVPVVAGYGVGLLLTYGALAFSIGGSQGQPALLYLVPCTLGCISLLGWWRGQFWELWHCGREVGQQQQGRQAADARLEAGLESERLLPAIGSPQSQAVV